MELVGGDLNLKATELRLGLPGTERTNKRVLQECGSKGGTPGVRRNVSETLPPAKNQIVGWPPVRSYRKNMLKEKKEGGEEADIYVKVSVDGAPYLRKIDLNLYDGYPKLLEALQTMFKLTIGEYSEREGYKGSEYEPTYEDKDGDWMLVGDVPWKMFVSSCKRLRIIKGSEVKGG